MVLGTDNLIIWGGLTRQSKMPPISNSLEVSIRLRGTGSRCFFSDVGLKFLAVELGDTGT